MSVIQIDVPCVPLCELLFKDPAEPADEARWVKKCVDFDQLVRLFQAVDYRYPLDPSESPQEADFDAIGARMAAFQEILAGMADHGPEPGRPVPPQTEGTIARLRAALYKAWDDRFREEKKTAGPAPPPGGGSGSLSLGPSPSAAPLAATPPAGPPRATAGAWTSPGKCSPG